MNTVKTFCECCSFQLSTTPREVLKLFLRNASDIAYPYVWTVNVRRTARSPVEKACGKSGRVGEWGSGRVGEWESARVRECALRGRSWVPTSYSSLVSRLLWLCFHSPTLPLSHSPTLSLVHSTTFPLSVPLKKKGAHSPTLPRSHSPTLALSHNLSRYDKEGTAPV